MFYTDIVTSRIQNCDAEVHVIISFQIYLGDHLTRSWTRDERRGSKQSPVASEPCQVLSAAGSAYQIKQSHSSISRARSSLREPRGSKRSWANKSSLHSVTTEEFQRWKLSFEDLLSSPVGSKLFRIFLESEIAEENLLFWEACEELKQMKKEKRMQKLIQTIFDDFISVYSPREINIDYKMREDIVEQLNNKQGPDPNVFREAQTQIYHLMHRDSYPRFLLSVQQEQRNLEEIRREKQQHQHRREPEHKAKSRILCCYSDDAVDCGTPGRFIPTGYEEVQEDQSPKRKIGESDPEPSSFRQKKRLSKSGSCTSVPDVITSVQTRREVIKVEISAPVQDEEAGRKTSNSGTEYSSKRESGIESCSTYCENEGGKMESDSEIAQNVIVDPTTSEVVPAESPHCDEIVVSSEKLIECDVTGYMKTDSDRNVILDEKATTN